MKKALESELGGLLSAVSGEPDSEKENKPASKLSIASLQLDVESRESVVRKSIAAGRDGLFAALSSEPEPIEVSQPKPKKEEIVKYVCVPCVCVRYVGVACVCVCVHAWCARVCVGTCVQAHLL